MSRLTRFALAALVALAVIVGIFSSVNSASENVAKERSGSHLVSGARVNLDHYRESAPAPAASELEDEFGPNRQMGCDHESQTSPED